MEKIIIFSMDVQLKVRECQCDFGSLTYDCKSYFLEVVYYQVNMIINQFHTNISNIIWYNASTCKTNKKTLINPTMFTCLFCTTYFFMATFSTRLHNLSNFLIHLWAIYKFLKQFIMLDSVFYSTSVRLSFCKFSKKIW